jgi:hypothetical protein
MQQGLRSVPGQQCVQHVSSMWWCSGCNCCVYCGSNFSGVARPAVDLAAVESLCYCFSRCFVLFYFGVCRRCVTTWECLLPALLPSTWMGAPATSAGERIQGSAFCLRCRQHNIAPHRRNSCCAPPGWGRLPHQQVEGPPATFALQRHCKACAAYNITMHHPSVVLHNQCCSSDLSMGKWSLQGPGVSHVILPP